MKLAVISLGLMALPLAAQAAPRDITPMARYCVEALVDSRPLMTSALIATTAKNVGRGDADERTEFYTVPHEELVFSRLQLSGLSACSVFPEDGAEGWSEASVAKHMEVAGMLAAPDCAKDGVAFWFSPVANLKRRGVTAVVEVAKGEVAEILAYETMELSRPSDCKTEAAQ